jgi:iron(III) transport system substrate-binding protein
MMSRTSRIALVGCAAILVASCSGTASPSPTTGPTVSESATPAPPTSSSSEIPSGSAGSTAYDAACQAATGEGDLVLWGGSDEATIRSIFDVFSQSHPGIKLDYLSIGGADSIQRLITEHAAGQPVTVDLLDASPSDGAGLVDRGVVDQQVDWKALGVDPSQITSQNSVIWQGDADGIVYNTSLVSAADLPTTWDSLIDPKWANGKIVVDPRGRPFDSLSVVWGEQKTLDYVQKLKALKPSIIQGSTAGMVSVGSGEAAMTTTGSTVNTKEQQAKGAPLAIQYLDLVPVDVGAVMRLAGAPHPNAALCYGGWIAGPEGQAEVLKVDFINAAPPQLSSGSQEISIDTSAKSELVSSMSAKIAAIWAK